MKEETYTDEQLVQMIAATGRQRKEALRYIFLNWRGSAIAILRSNKKQQSDIEDAISGAIIVLDNHIRNKSYEAKGALKNYFIGICKGKVYSAERSQKRIQNTDKEGDLDGIETKHPETLMLAEEQKQQVNNILKQLEPKCREVLQLFKLHHSNSEIAEKVDLGNAANARQWVFRCKKRMKDLLEKSPFFKNYSKQ